MNLLLLLLALLTPVKASDKPPSIYTVDCWSVTNCWPFSDDGQLTAWGGQADGAPNYTANMTEITSPQQAWDWVAGPLPLVGKTVTIPGYGTYLVNDTFGATAYQEGVFYHDGYGRYVIGIDIFTPQPIHELVCGGTIN